MREANIGDLPEKTMAILFCVNTRFMIGFVDDAPLDFWRLHLIPEDESFQALTYTASTA